jgi:hypothetical protein
VGSELETVAVPPEGVGAATGVANPTGAADESGAASQSTGTPRQEAPRPTGVSEEDFKRYQRSMNQQTDALRQQLASVQSGAQQAMEAMRQELEAKEREILEIKTAGLPPDEVETIRLKSDRDALRRKLDQAVANLKQREEALSRMAVEVEEKKARQTVIQLLLKGDKHNGIEGYEQYGVTVTELEEFDDPRQMERFARRKMAEALRNEKEQLAKEKAAIAAAKRAGTGATAFDKGEPTSGGAAMPKIGTKEFRAFVEEVKAGKRRLR